ncbi:MAG: hypothetical protein ACI8W7_003944 [Gammaproteobacteria bacterium]|jgi:hypothetical protein
MPMPDNGLVVVAKRDCPTCQLAEPVYAQLDAGAEPFTLYSQDDPQFPVGISNVADDSTLHASWRLQIDTVPTLLRIENGQEVARAIGWHRGEWEALSGMQNLGAALPAEQPGCGSMSVDPGMAEVLEVRYGSPPMRSRPIEGFEPDDPVELCYQRGWSDGLPVVPPTRERVLRMLAGTTRAADEVLGLMPPDLGECTVEKVAINAVLAGCRPEYLPVVLAAVEAALVPAFCMHGLLCTTYFASPIVIVNGPITRRIGMNSGVNALGQGNRANSTIGRALQLVVRNVGGGVPGGIDRATLGTPSKIGLCFAEDESNQEWQPLAQARGVASGRSAVTLFGGGEVIGNFDQKSRTAQSLSASLASTLIVAGHTKLVQRHDAVLVLSPEHYRVFQQNGWDRQRIGEELKQASTRDGAQLVRGAGGIAEGMPATVAGSQQHKFRDGGLQIVRAGGEAGMMSAMIIGWAATGETGSEPVTKEIGT